MKTASPKTIDIIISPQRRVDPPVQGLRGPRMFGGDPAAGGGAGHGQQRPAYQRVLCERPSQKPPGGAGEEA